MAEMQEWANNVCPLQMQKSVESTQNTTVVQSRLNYNCDMGMNQHSSVPVPVPRRKSNNPTNFPSNTNSRLIMLLN